MKVIKQLFFLSSFFIILLQCPLTGQQNQPVSYFPYKLYTTKDGMTETFTSCIYQDSKGFIWVGTKQGINKFDGLQYETPLNNAGFPNDHIYDIDMDTNGRIWLAGQNGIYLFQKDTFSNLLPDSMSHLKARWIAAGKDGTIWLIHNLGKRELYTFDGNVWIKVTLQQPDYQSLSKIEALPDGGILLIAYFKDTFRKLLWIDEKGHQQFIEIDKKSDFRKIDLFKRQEQVFVRLDSGIYTFSKGKLQLIKQVDIPYEQFVVRGEEVIITDFKRIYKWYNNQWTDYGYDLNQVREMIVDADDRLWIATESGLVKVKTEALMVYPPERGMLRNAWNILEDETGDFWISAYQYGLRKLTKNGVYRNVAGYKKLQYSISPFFSTGALHRSNGDLLFPSSGNVIAYNHKIGFFELEGSYEASKSYQDIKEINDSLFLATKGFKIIYKQSSVLYGNEEGLDMDNLRYIESIERDKKGIWWLGSKHGLATFNGKEFKNYYVDKDIPAGIQGIFKDVHQNLWFATKKGISLYDYTSQLPKPILKSEITKPVQFISNIDSTYLLLGMLDKIKVIDLAAYYRGENIFYEINEENGFEGEDCIQESGYEDRQGNVWIATRSCMLKLIPDQLKITNTPTPVQLKSAKTAATNGDNEVYKFIDVSTRKEIIIASQEKLAIDFFTINHFNPQSIQYQYWLRGYENGWSPPSAQRFAFYSNLPIGKYVFEVRSFLNGNHSDAVSIPITVKATHIVETMWFKYLMISLAVILLSGFVIQTISRNLDKQKTERLQREVLQKEVEQLQMRQKLLFNQANPHFTFNILSAINGLIAQKRLQEARRFIGMFGQLFRPMLFDNGKLTKTLKEEITFAEDYLKLERLRFPDKFDYYLNIDDDVNPNILVPKMAIQTFVSNAIKHGIEPLKGRKGVLKISITQEGEFICIIIEDNGIGLPEAKNNNYSKGTGNGIKIIKGLFDMLNEDYPGNQINITELTDDDNYSKGTKVLLQISTNIQEN